MLKILKLRKMIKDEDYELNLWDSLKYRLEERRKSQELRPSQRVRRDSSETINDEHDRFEKIDNNFIFFNTKIEEKQGMIDIHLPKTERDSHKTKHRG